MRNKDKNEDVKKKSWFKRLAVASAGIAATSALFVYVRKQGATR